MLRPSSRLREGEPLDLLGYPGKLVLAESLGRGLWSARVEPPARVLQILERIGRAPLPPYIKRQPDSDDLIDRRRYQTVFARRPGSVAAPTAGLHFNQRMFKSLRAKGIRHTYITLHVGLGTFAPITSQSLEQHQMHREWFNISKASVEQIRVARAAGHLALAVGSTSLRVLEAACACGKLTAGQGWTDIFIQPGYQFGATDALLTNFHLPRSTLLVLVCAFASSELIFEAYQQAIARKYRFYSYGDAMLIL
jgi:S-adenosylmethionine:tRNA ribosyltransferase-isomerase